MNNYWDKRLRLLDAINDNGYKKPLSVLCSNIFAPGSSLSNITNELEEKGLIIRVKSKFVQTFLTAKGETALNLLKELKKIWE